MKIPIIKQLVETHTAAELEAAEAAIAEGEQPQIAIEGADEGEQLTHAYAALWIRSKVEKEGLDFKTALREYTQRVRNCIS